MEEFIYPANMTYNPRCWAEGNRLPYSQFCFTPYRPAYAGPFIPGAHQRVQHVTACPSQGWSPPGTPVAQRANLCASGRSYNGFCLQ